MTILRFKTVLYESCVDNTLGGVDDKFYHHLFILPPFVHDLHTTISNKKTFLRDFLVILMRKLQNYWQILKTCFLVTTTCIVIYLACSDSQPNNSVSSAAKGLNRYMCIWYDNVHTLFTQEWENISIRSSITDLKKCFFTQWIIY